MSGTPIWSWLEALVVFTGWTVLAYFVIVNGFYIMLMLSAAWELRWHFFEVRGESRQRVLSSALAPKISVLVPAYNEADTIEQSVRALLTLAYPDLEIIVVDDGSTDDTVELLRPAFDLTPIHPIYRRQIATAQVNTIFRSRIFPNLVVAAKENGGKADALNAGLSLASGELACAIDADTIVEEDAMQRLVRPFLRSDDVVAAGATIRIANDCRINSGRVIEVRTPRRAIPGVQAVEYLRAFLFGRVGWNRLGGNLVISGAFGLFRRDVLLMDGGYAHGVGEDIELITRLRRRGYETGERRRVEFVPDPVAWTEAPASIRVLARQRNRWHRGLSETLWRHKRLLFNPRYGALGLVVYPAFLIVEWLAPVLEVLGLISLAIGLSFGWLDSSFAVLFLLLAYGVGLVLSTCALVLEEISFRGYGSVRERTLLLVWAIVESLGFRQLTVWWRLQGIIDFLRGRTEWGKMERKGFDTTATESPETSEVQAPEAQAQL